MSNLNAALYYLEKLKWSVIPISPGTKDRPMVKWSDYQDHLPTREEVTKWWTDNPNANIAAITGKISNLFVVDHDKYKPEYSHDEALKYFPDSIETPIAKSPRGGEHQYYQHAEIKNPTTKTSIIPAVDTRGDGGIIILPPSVNGNGKKYEWIIKPSDVPLAAAPISFINKINSIVYGGVTDQEKSVREDVLQSVTINLNKGTRDDSLFHIAHTMMKGGASLKDIEIVLTLVSERCKPPFPKDEMFAKIESVLSRAKRKERNLAKEVDSYIAVTSGAHSVTSCYTALQVVTKEDKTAVRVHYHRLLKQGVIEKYGDKDGWYRRVENNLEFITIDENDKDDDPYPVKLPLGINDLVEICDGDIILIGGEFNAGKTSFILNVLQMNKNRVPIRYQSSEMNAKAFKRRFRGFGLPLSFWVQDDMMQYVKRNSDFANAIEPNSLNIIDYLEFKDSDYTKGAEILTAIHEKLQKGIAVIAVQKKEGQRLPRSGDMIMEKPRFAMTMTKVPGEKDVGIAEIIKAKEVKLGKCDGKRLRYEIKDLGSRFLVLNDWGWWR